MNKALRTLGLWLLLGLITVSLASNMWGAREQPRSISLSQFLEKWMAGDVRELHIIGEHQVEGKFRDGTDFQTYAPDITLLTDRLKEKPDIFKQVEITAEPAPSPPWWASILPQVVGMLFFVGLWIFILNQMQGGGNRAIAFGKSRARLHVEEKGKTTFADVAGVDEAKEELAEIVEFLKHPKKFIELGAKIPRGILLVGPPGTGKTLLGRAVAGEAGVPFFIISGSDFVEMFVGVGAARVRDLFDQAKKNAPCIVFIDEIDAVGRQRGAGLGGGHDEREQTLNQLLVEMDGFEANNGIIVLAATNRPDVLDPALLRPGRFDRQIVVDMPDLAGREAILRVHARGKPLGPDVDLKTLARRTPGFTGADLENMLNEASLLAARRNKKKITMLECDEAIDRVVAGPERKSRIMSEKERNLVAYHESGHALVAKLLPHANPVHKVSIIPRGRAGGYTLMFPDEDRYFLTRSEMLDEVTVLMAGRVAEEVAFDEVSTGAQNDIEKATRMVRKMITEYGMSERLGPLTLGGRHEDTVFLGRDIARERNYSEEVAAAIDEEIHSIITACYERAKTLIVNNRSRLERIVAVLKEKETIEGAELEALLNEVAFGEDADHERSSGRAAAVAAEREPQATVSGQGAQGSKEPRKPRVLAENPGTA
ncbi:MAG TPA: ATP-dependent zinc metalloprotease FtsH [Firmicutes bacterium]|nr:ATP-dependent zinc metalloprotease FtsH [Bacillota bacterium]